MSEGSNSNNILGRIVEARREWVSHRKRVLPEVALRIAVEKKAPAVRDFSGALTRAPLNVIAELKKASPSHGLLRQDYQPSALGLGLESAGAAALSVLTEEDFFQGALLHLKEAHRVVKIPVLRKDFIFDPWQVWETRAGEADSFLLIAAILEDDRLGELLELGRRLKMEALLEVHTRQEVERVRKAGARIIGVNNRDLRDFRVRLETSLELIEEIPNTCIAVSESGIRSRDDLERLREAGFDAVLVGEHLMTKPDPAGALRDLLEPEQDGARRRAARPESHG